MNTGTQRT